MVEKIEFTVPDGIAKLFHDVCLSDNLEVFARTLFLKSLACEYMTYNDDETAKRIERAIENLNY